VGSSRFGPSQGLVVETSCLAKTDRFLREGKGGRGRTATGKSLVGSSAAVRRSAQSGGPERYPGGTSHSILLGEEEGGQRTGAPPRRRCRTLRVTREKMDIRDRSYFTTGEGGKEDTGRAWDEKAVALKRAAYTGPVGAGRMKRLSVDKRLHPSRGRKGRKSLVVRGRPRPSADGSGATPKPQDQARIGPPAKIPL